jgi:peptide/nickel transport system substrate-binding protein
MSRAVALLAIAALAVTVASGCSKSGQTAGPSDELRIALPINPMQLNPILPQNTIENFLDGLIFDVLVTQDAQHHQIPDLAAVVPTVRNGGISKDGRTIVYRLRHGVTWHDGAPFTSKDVKFTWQAVMNPANNVLTRHGYDDISSIDTPDDYTVVMHLKRMFPPAIDTIFGESDTIYRILPAHLLQKYANLNQVPFDAAPIGTGPYKFARWLRGDRILLVANPNYFRGAPKIGHLTLTIVQDDNTTAAQIHAHEIDLGLEISAPAYASLADAPGVVRQLVDAPSYTSLLFNTTRPPLDDVRVRRALVLGLDRARITRNQTQGTGKLAVADLSPFYWAFDPALKPVPYDPAQAKALLDAAGWHAGSDGVRVRNGKRLSLQVVFGQGSQLARNVTVEVQQMYRALGIEIALKSYDYATYYASTQSGGILNGGKFDIALYAWVSGADPDDSSQWMCDAIPPAGNNVSRYCSAEMDAAQRAALSTYDRGARAKAYARIEALLLRDAPGAFIYYQALRYGHVSGLQNFEPNGTSEGWNAQDWRLEALTR